MMKDAFVFGVPKSLEKITISNSYIAKINKSELIYDLIENKQKILH